MDGYVAHPAHLRPGKLRVWLDEVRRDAVDLVYGLADDLDIAHNRVLNLRTFLKGFDVMDGLKIARRPLNRFRNMFQIVLDASGCFIGQPGPFREFCTLVKALWRAPLDTSQNIGGGAF